MACPLEPFTFGAQCTHAKIYNGMDASLTCYICALPHFIYPERDFSSNGKNGRDKISVIWEEVIDSSSPKTIILEELLLFDAISRPISFEIAITYIFNERWWQFNCIKAQSRKILQQEDLWPTCRLHHANIEHPIQLDSAEPMHINWHCSLFLILWMNHARLRGIYLFGDIIPLLQVHTIGWFWFFF